VQAEAALELVDGAGAFGEAGEEAELDGAEEGLRGPESSADLKNFFGRRRA
jgi:hypothetical protein